MLGVVRVFLYFVLPKPTQPCRKFSRLTVLAGVLAWDLSCCFPGILMLLLRGLVRWMQANTKNGYNAYRQRYLECLITLCPGRIPTPDSIFHIAQTIGLRPHHVRGNRMLLSATRLTTTSYIRARSRTCSRAVLKSKQAALSLYRGGARSRIHQSCSFCELLVN